MLALAPVPNIERAYNHNWQSQMLNGETQSPPPRAERKYRLLRGLMQTAGRADIPVVIRNISSRGLGASTSESPPMVGAEVTVLLPSGKTAAGSVRWTNGRNFGIAFFEQIVLDDQKVDRSADTPASTWEVKTLHRIDMPRVDPAKLRRL